jgi:hypothetical protein
VRIQGREDEEEDVRTDFERIGWMTLRVDLEARGSRTKALRFEEFLSDSLSRDSPNWVFGNHVVGCGGRWNRKSKSLLSVCLIRTLKLEIGLVDEAGNGIAEQAVEVRCSTEQSLMLP